MQLAALYVITARPWRVPNKLIDVIFLIALLMFLIGTRLLPFHYMPGRPLHRLSSMIFIHAHFFWY
jgi:hypothetical protein